MVPSGTYPVYHSAFHDMTISLQCQDKKRLWMQIWLFLFFWLIVSDYSQILLPSMMSLNMFYSFLKEKKWKLTAEYLTAEIHMLTLCIYEM